MIFKKPWIIACFLTSLFLILLSVVLTFTGVQGQSIGFRDLSILFLAQIGGSVFFPLVVGIIYDKIRHEMGMETIWSVFRDLSDGGIIRFYMDREENDRPQNAQIDLRKALDDVKIGEVKLVGVSLRVFFNQPGAFYQSIYKLCELSEISSKIKIKALVSHFDSPEVLNRSIIETPDRVDAPLIKMDISSTIASIANINKNLPSKPIEYGAYKQAPYCTCVIFPDKCFFSPNILAKDPPVRLPMIVFKSGSNGYEKLNLYFNHLWSNRVNSEDICDFRANGQ